MKVRKMSYRRHCASCAQCSRLSVELAANLVAQGSLSWATPEVKLQAAGLMATADYLRSQRPMGVLTVTDTVGDLHWGVLYSRAVLIASTRWVSSDPSVLLVCELGENQLPLSFDHALSVFDGWARTRGLCLTESIQLEG